MQEESELVPNDILIWLKSQESGLGHTDPTETKGGLDSRQQVLLPHHLLELQQPTVSPFYCCTNTNSCVKVSSKWKPSEEQPQVQRWWYCVSEEGEAPSWRPKESQIARGGVRGLIYRLTTGCSEDISCSTRKMYTSCQYDSTPDDIKNWFLCGTSIFWISRCNIFSLSQ